MYIPDDAGITEGKRPARPTRRSSRNAAVAIGVRAEAREPGEWDDSPGVSGMPDTDGADTSLVVTGASEAWRRHGDEVAAALGSDPRRGLSAAEAEARLERFGANRLQEPGRHLPGGSPPTVRRPVDLPAAGRGCRLAGGVGDRPRGVGAVRGDRDPGDHPCQRRARLRAGGPRRAGGSGAPANGGGDRRVLRDGEPHRVAAADVVPGDVLLLAEGDAVAADGRLVEAASLTVAEASLTGESEPVLKELAALAGDAGLGDRENMVFSGTAVTRGRGRAVVTATGRRPRWARSHGCWAAPRENDAAPARARADRPDARGRGDRHRGRRRRDDLADFRHEDGLGLVEVLLVAVSLAVAAIPEGLPAVTTIVLALGTSAWRDATRSSGACRRSRRSAARRSSAPTRPARSRRTP